VSRPPLCYCRPDLDIAIEVQFALGAHARLSRGPALAVKRGQDALWSRSGCACTSSGRPARARSGVAKAAGANRSTSQSSRDSRGTDMRPSRTAVPEELGQMPLVAGLARGEIRLDGIRCSPDAGDG